jgi:tRNA threonylcarbamoyladenosine biosynthesis protein TsaE
MDLDITTNSPEETIELGRKVGSQLKGGEIIAVCGALGSGKTHLIKGIVSGAGAAESKKVTSPTFIIINEYKSHPPKSLDIYHIDAYRLDSIPEFEMLGFDDYCRPGSVVLIEWADKIESALADMDYIRAELFHAEKSKRKIHIKNMPDCIHLR